MHNPDATLTSSHAAEEQGPGLASGVLPSQMLRTAIDQEWITSGEYRIPAKSVQPASLDLRLGDYALALRCSFLPDPASTVEEKVRDIAFQRIDIRDGAVLETDRPYLVPLIEGLRLPEHVRAKANPKSSTGRLDVFTRVITDRNHQYDEIVAGYEGRMYLEIVPRSFAIHVRTGLSMNQLRLICGEPEMTDPEIHTLHERTPLLYDGDQPVGDISTSRGLYVSLDLQGPRDRIVGFRAKRNSLPIDLSRIRAYSWRDFWEPVYPEAADRIVLEPEIFYLLLSNEGVCIPPEYAAEMTAIDPSVGELRTHYAGFFDPGFGYDAAGARHGSRAALEVRAHDVPFMIEHRQLVGLLRFERLQAVPDALYGAGLGSNYQGQVSMLSKHFVEQTAAAAPAPAA